MGKIIVSNYSMGIYDVVINRCWLEIQSSKNTAIRNDKSEKQK